MTEGKTGAAVKAAIIGGGASGMFCAANARRAAGGKTFQTRIYEASKTPLAKVLASGGGRCNFTNACEDLETFVSNYPRGGGRLRRIFRAFSSKDTIAWFSERGLKHKVEEDGKIFPVTDSAESVAELLIKEARKSGAEILTQNALEDFSVLEDGSFELTFANGKKERADRLVIAIGGLKEGKLSSTLKKLGHEFSPPLPSLFALKTADFGAALSGLSVEKVRLESADNKHVCARGALLFTREGLSGPATLRLSSFGAREFAKTSYSFKILADFLDGRDAGFPAAFFNDARKAHAKKLLRNWRPDGIPERLWEWMLERAKAPKDLCYANLPRQIQLDTERLLRRCEVEIRGRAPSGSEFVTCGGLKIESLSLSTMQSLKVPNLYFAGEFLDIDALTGGFNLQNAWSTGMICARNIYI